MGEGYSPWNEKNAVKMHQQHFLIFEKFAPQRPLGKTKIFQQCAHTPVWAVMISSYENRPTSPWGAITKTLKVGKVELWLC